MRKIIILDFGGQYCHLISRRIRDFGVFSKVVPSHISAHIVSKDTTIQGIILSGGARSVYETHGPKFDRAILQLGIPVLGICYGHQIIAHALGGKVIAGKMGEYGLTALSITHHTDIFSGLQHNQKVWMNHRDIVTALPQGFMPTAKTSATDIAAYSSPQKKIFGVQFHPEVSHTQKGNAILKNFVFKICHCEKSWSSRLLKRDIIEHARKTIGSQKAIIGLSGGIDSSVAAALVGSSIGKNLTAVYVDTGLMRYQETQEIQKIFSHTNLNLKIIRAGKIFFRALQGVTSPERKRKIIGKLFVDIFYEQAKKEKAKVLIQGTIYSDRIESGITKHSSKIKSHHNVGGLPKNLKLALYEPLRELYKDEVRKIAAELRLPKELVTRQVFPGPGLAIRIIGEVTPEKAEIVRRAGKIIEDELRNTAHWKKLWMSFPVLLPIKSVGVQGDARTYKYPIVLRIIESKDVMTANFSKLPWNLLEKISTRITNEIKEVNRVVYDITHKPPATMEWE